jgi:hypothetical protein
MYCFWLYLWFMSHRKGLGAEHPLNDRGQGVFLVVYLAVWSLDSFVFRFSTWFGGVVPIFVRQLGIEMVKSLQSS